MPNSSFSKKIILLLGDFISLILALFFALLFGFTAEFNFSVFLEHFPPFFVLSLVFILILYIIGFYDKSFFKIDTKFIYKLAVTLFVFFLLSAVFFYFFPLAISPKTNLLVYIILLGIIFPIWRQVAFSAITSRLSKNTAFVGKSEDADILKKELMEKPYFGYNVVDLNSKQDLMSQIKDKKVNILISGREISEIEKLKDNIYQIIKEKIELMDISQAYESILEKIPVSFITRSWFLKNIRESGKGVYERIKRLTDIILSLALIILTSPLWFIISLIIKLQDGGLIFYKQERVGKDNKIFKLIKFRSMREDAEKQGALWAKEDDPRATPFGRFLRKSHLDEIPQLINILKGDISFVGPRPERPEFVVELEEKIPHYRIRHVIKPGFTGWAQIKFRYARSVEDSKEKFEYDLFYLKNRSLFLDIGIILKTIQKFFS